MDCRRERAGRKRRSLDVIDSCYVAMAAYWVLERSGQRAEGKRSIVLSCEGEPGEFDEAKVEECIPPRQREANSFD